MPDITMCRDHACPQREQCYRYTATPHEYRQSYFAGSPAKPDGTCDLFMQSEFAAGKPGNAAASGRS